VTNRITKFSEAYRFLSNFFPSTVSVSFTANGERRVFSMPTVENAYQACKIDPHSLTRIAKTHEFTTMTAGEAKKAGRRVPLRDDWEEIKLEVMIRLLREKFSDPDLKKRLLDTGDAELVEGNHWGDRYWGVDSHLGVGENHLGRSLMQVRDELRAGELK